MPVWWSLCSWHPTPAARKNRDNAFAFPLGLSKYCRLKIPPSMCVECCIITARCLRVCMQLTMKRICPRSPMGLKYMTSYWSLRWGTTIWEPIRPANHQQIKKKHIQSHLCVMILQMSTRGSIYGGTVAIQTTSSLMGQHNDVFFKLTQPIDHISTQKTSGTKHSCRYSTGGRASSFPFGDDSMVQLPLLDCGDGGSWQHSRGAATCWDESNTGSVWSTSGGETHSVATC